MLNELFSSIGMWVKQLKLVEHVVFCLISTEEQTLRLGMLSALTMKPETINLRITTNQATLYNRYQAKHVEVT